jgi:DNA-binding transcriptional MerR regulator
MAYTVKQLSDLAGVSIRTLHYYDEIGLLKPAAYGVNGYRYYSEGDLLRLQQLLFFKELGLSLEEIEEIIDRPDFDVLHALETHKLALQLKVKRLDRLIQTVDNTIMHLKGNLEMSKKQYFEGFTEEKQRQYAKEARRLYGEKSVKASEDLWNSYTPEKKAAIQAEQQQIYQDLVAVMDKGYDSPEVQQVVARWHQHLRYFYEPSVERLQGLGHLYNQSPDFIATFQKIHPDLPAFLEKAITFYCQNLPTP